MHIKGKETILRVRGTRERNQGLSSEEENITVGREIIDDASMSFQSCLNVIHVSSKAIENNAGR